MPFLRSMDPEPTPLDVTDPEALFPCDLDQARHIFHELAGRWHPDRNKDARATRVFQHISDLYHEAVRRIENGVWQGPGTIQTPSTTISYFKSFPFELGQTYIGRDHVTYVLSPTFKRFYDNAKQTIESLRFADSEMKKEVSRYVPVRYEAFQASDGRFGLSIPKSPEQILLRDVVAHYDKFNPKHAAWILSTLYNLSCYFEYAGIVHHDISLDTYFVNPAEHSGMLVGGWWYAAPVGSTVSELPTRTANLLPWTVKTQKVASLLADQELIRAIGREACARADSVPPAMRQWLDSVATGTARENYREWKEVAVKSFGPRRFTEMKLDHESLYGKEKSNGRRTMGR